MQSLLALVLLSAAALEALKPEFRYKTSLLIPESEAGKENVSALVWHGTGDPSISGRGRASLYEIFDIWGASPPRGCCLKDYCVLAFAGSFIGSAFLVSLKTAVSVCFPFS